MPNHYIATKLHLLDFDHPELVQALRHFRWVEKVPHYVIDESLIALLDRSDVKASIAAMIEAEVCHLPFPKMLIELPVAGGEIHCFVGLEEVPYGFGGVLTVLDNKANSVAVERTPYCFAPKDGVLIHEWGEAETKPGLGDRILTGSKIFHDNAAMHPHQPAGKAASMLANSTVCVALQIALLMLNIQGVGKEVIEPTRLNRSRVASGKPPIPKHTVMRIAHVYDSDGKRHIIGSHKRIMSVHMRAGHARRQHYGEGNAETKIIYIPPVLVNFRPGAEVKVPRRIIAA